MEAMRKHIMIPDLQVTPDTPMDHLTWIGEYILEQRPDVVIQIGDLADMESLSQYDKGKKSFEGRRYKRDIDSAHKAMRLLNQPIDTYNLKQVQFKKKQYKPEKEITLGNHEYRIQRAIEDDARLDGTLGLQDLAYEHYGWRTHDFLKPVEIDGITYAHYFSNPLSGRPFGGQSIDTRLKTIGFSFTMGHQQVCMTGQRYLNNGARIRGLVCGACLTPDHKVLTSDLRYVPLGEIKAGDKLVSFDENPAEKRKRRYQEGTVLRTKRKVMECFAVTLESGKVFKVTGDHKWLVRVGGQTSVKEGSSYMWRETRAMRKGTKVPVLFDEWETLQCHESGYLAGMYDGEGTIYGRETCAKGGSVMQLSVCQKEGPVLDRTKKALKSLVGVGNLTYTRQGDVTSMRIKGGANKCAKMLGSVRPTRLLNKFKPEWLGSVQTTVNDKVASIEPIGEQEIVMIDIDHKTMIVEGYPHHNCYLHDEDYMGHQGNAYWRGIFVKHEVRNGEYDLMEVSLDYLCRKYEDMPLWEFMKRKYPELFERSIWMKRQEHLHGLTQGAA